MANFRFSAAFLRERGARYFKILYKLESRDGYGGDLIINVGGSAWTRLFVAHDLPDTEGEYRLSDTMSLIDGDIAKFYDGGEYATTENNTFNLVKTKSCTDCRLKCIYFFKTREAADSYVPPKGDRRIKINGNPIENYRVVIPYDNEVAELAAGLMLTHIEYLSGVKLPVVTDREPESEYEILFGRSSRKITEEVLSEYEKDGDTYRLFAVGSVGNKLVVTSENAFSLDTAAQEINEKCLYEQEANVPETIELTDGLPFTGLGTRLTPYDKWQPHENAPAEKYFTDDFTSDTGTWTEENGKKAWKIENGMLSCTAEGREAAFVQYFEANAKFRARIKYTTAEKYGDMGVMLRYTAIFAYLKAGYDFKNGEWYIEYREGRDHYIERIASKKAVLAPDTFYVLEFVADKTHASLSVNGIELVSSDSCAHVTPGRFGVYAREATVSVADVKVTMLTDLGNLMRGVTHPLLPRDGLEGGTIIEMGDGTLIYDYMGRIAFKSDPKGVKWEETETYFTHSSYPQILRLNNGDFLMINRKAIDGITHRVAYISSDDGKTWLEGGVVCSEVRPEFAPIAVVGVNMNDKVTQMSNGRIFYCQGFDSTKNKGKDRIVYSEVYYSDDNGLSWTNSENSSWDHEKIYFSESKVLECADGTLRLYNSWNQLGCLAYMESWDNGKTWGPIVKMKDYVCSRTSMQFARDPYGETPTTYYMIWVNSEPEPGKPGHNMTRARLTLEKTTDGKSWTKVGDLWYWESRYRRTTGSCAVLQHCCDTFVACTKETIFAGSGIAEYLELPGKPFHPTHGHQNQHIWAINRDYIE